ncbi:putative NAD(P)-binding domain-containing protein [Seiridium unicorne]|uniref:NAD(P)-binding domain-containing protein n=1 Tax=Seiridium unicorne TaxID=138068 RepID=A0ABR2UKC0_9PEZI
MVSLKVVQQSNAQVANLPRGLVALFIGATSGIGESALQHFAQHAPAPRIYTVARPSTAASHEKLISSLRLSKPEGTYKLITADVSLVSEIDKVVKAVVNKETKIDFLVIIVHWFPGPVTTPGLERAQKHGMNIPDPMSQEESGARALFLATSDRYAVQKGLVAVPEGVEMAEKTRGGIFLVGPLGETIDKEVVLTDMRERGVGEAVWNFTQMVFAASVAQSDERRDEL